MTIARSRVTAQGQVSVPAEIRRRLGVEPGSILEWEQEGEEIVVRRAGRFSSLDLHRILFAEAPKRRSLKELDDGPRKHAREHHARR